MAHAPILAVHLEFWMAVLTQDATHVVFKRAAQDVTGRAVSET